MSAMINFEALMAREAKIAVVGLGYVGLPLAIHLSVNNLARVISLK